jgi:hypothetical protein
MIDLVDSVTADTDIQPGLRCTAFPPAVAENWLAAIIRDLIAFASI